MATKGENFKEHKHCSYSHHRMKCIYKPK